MTTPAPSRFPSRVRRAACLLLALAGVRDVRAQSVVRGTVRDSASGLPVPGAIVTLLDSAGTPMTRNLSNERGLYRATLLAPARRVRVVRLGFRPRDLAIPPVTNGEALLDVTLQSIPFLLAPVRVSAGANCPRRSDRAAALALLEQARSGLLATVVARAQAPAAMTRLLFQRSLDGNGDRIVRQAVRLDSTTSGTASFGAVQSAADFVRYGFMKDVDGSQVFYAPDAEVLLDDGFANGYCFHVMPRDAGRPNEIGLGFRPARGRRPSVEIEGALWIDTLARALDDVVFRYVGLGDAIEDYRPGGRVAFRDMGNGVVFVDRWSLRLVGGTADSVVVRARDGTVQRVPKPTPYVEETGGELATAAFPDGRTWHASLGTLRAHLVTPAGQPAAGVVLTLDHTDYRVAADSAGDVEIPDLVPGPYTASVVDPRLALIGVAMPTPLAFVAERGATVRRVLEAPTADAYVAARCAADHRIAPATSTRLVGRVLTAADEPVGGMSITLIELTGAVERAIGASYTTGTDGMFQFCLDELRPGMTLAIRASHERMRAIEIVRALEDGLTVVRIPFSRRP